MKSRFVYSQRAWDRFKFFVRGPSSLIYQSQAEAIAFRDAFHRNTEMWKLLDQYISTCNSGVGHLGPASRDEGLHRKISFYEVNIDSDLHDWANSQISILKASGKNNNKLAFDLLKKIGTRAVTEKDFRSNSREVVKTDRSKPELSSSPNRNTSQPEKSISKPPSDNSEPLVYNHKNKSSGESSDFKYLENKMESYRVDEPKRPLDYSDYFDKIRTGNDFLFLAISKVFPEIQVYGKDLKQKHKIEQYWKIENKEKIKNKLIEISENPWINKNYPHIPLLLPDAVTKLDKKISEV
jgi:hypothetical protein